MSDHLREHSRRNSNDENDELSLAQRLEQYALPCFTLACDYAKSQDLQASVEFEQNDPQLTRLRLTVRRPEEAIASSYQVVAQESAQQVIHEQYFAADQSTQREETLPAAINTMVLDSRLEAFFSRAFNMLLPYLKESHPPGF